VKLRVDRREGELVSRQWVPLPPEELFRFLADPNNLEEITPRFLRFRVLTVSSREVRRGTIIRYRLDLRGAPLWWRTVIDRWEPPVCFTDRQESAPFKFWVHDK
jgi:ligand-binding SRPBCC domain-containing protein